MTDFTIDEWSTMRQAMVGAAVLVSVSEGGKANDMLSEMLAVSAKLRAAATGHASRLVRELAAGRRFPSPFRPGIKMSELEAPVLEAIRSARATLGARAPADAAAFGDFVVELAETAANAHRERRFMGIGGTQVSSAEAAAIAKVREALGLPPAP